MDKNKKENESISILKAKKHVQISLKVKDSINQICPLYNVYLATHSAGRHGSNYQKVEEESGERFWKLPFYSQINRKGKLKEPDIIITDRKIVKYLIEVKWGAIDKCQDTDAFISENDREKLGNAYNVGRKFKIRGPVIENCKLYDK